MPTKSCLGASRLTRQTDHRILQVFQVFAPKAVSRAPGRRQNARRRSHERIRFHGRTLARVGTEGGGAPPDSGARSADAKRTPNGLFASATASAHSRRECRRDTRAHRDPSVRAPRDAKSHMMWLEGVDRHDSERRRAERPASPIGPSLPAHCGRKCQCPQPLGGGAGEGFRLVTPYPIPQGLSPDPAKPFAMKSRALFRLVDGSRVSVVDSYC